MSEIRLLKLLPEQIAEHWDELSQAVQLSLPPIADAESPDRINRILQAFLSGELELHTFSRVNSDNNGLLVLISTSFQRTFDSDHLTMLIYSIFAYQRGTPEEWKAGWNLLEAYAKTKGVRLITGYTTQPGLRAYFRKMGGDDNWILLRKFI